MDITRRTRRSDYLGRYYTQSVVGELLVRAMALEAPRTVIDLGTGSGVLVKAAAKAWTEAEFLTVDIDKNASAGAGICKRVSIRHHVGDALHQNLYQNIGLTETKACAAVCNPPYIRPRWRSHFQQILDEVGLSQVLPKADDVPADILFVAQNLRLLKEGGRLGVILPDGLISGDRFRVFRRLLIEQHSVQQVIELPIGIFSRTEAKAHILILSKGAGEQLRTIQIRRLASDGTLSDALLINSDAAKERADFSYHSQRSSSLERAHTELGALVSRVQRGKHSSSEVRNAAVPIFHSTDFNESSSKVPGHLLWRRGLSPLDRGVFAKKGDVLIARVGRNLSTKICRVHKGRVLISDCILALTPTRGDEDRLFRALTSKKGREAVEAISHGVGAKFITPGALLKIRI